MKKIYSLFAALATLLGAAAPSTAATLSVNVDHADLVSMTVDGTPYALQDGDNTFSVNDYGTAYFTPAEGAIITQLTKNGYTSGSYITSTQSVYLSGDSQISITTGILEELETGSFNLKIDNPDKVRMMLISTYRNLGGLSAGDNTVGYIPGADNSLQISPANYGEVLYKVTKNGETITPSYGEYSIYIEEGMNVEVLADFPDVEVPVTFVFKNDGKDFVTSVTRTDASGAQTDIPNFAEGEFKVKAGDKITVNGNTSDFKFNSLSVNGASEYSFYGSYTFTVTEATTVEIDAEKYAMFNATVNVDDASRVIFYRGYSYNNDVIPLNTGENHIEISSSNPMVSVAPTYGNLISSVSINGSTVSPDYSGSYVVTVTDNCVIDIVSAEIVKDNKLVIWLDQQPSSDYGVMVYDNQRNQFSLTPGYNEIDYASNQAPFNIGIYDQAVAEVYLNDQAVAPAYEGGSYFSFTPEEKVSVAKIFTAASAESKNVTFTVSDEVAVEFSVVRDLVTSVDPTSPLSTFAGTRVDIAAVSAVDDEEASSPLAVTVNGIPVSAVNGVHSFVVTDDTEVSIVKSTVGIDQVIASGNAFTVYNIQGIRILSNASADEIKALPAGLYIVNGKKIIKY